MTTADPQPVYVPVMPREVMQWLQLTSGLTVLDGTVGAGGHSILIRKVIGDTGTLIGLDRDPMMLRLASQKLTGAPSDTGGEAAVNLHLVRSNYAEAAGVLQTLGIDGYYWILDFRLTSFRIGSEDLELMRAGLWICGFIRMKESRPPNC